MKKKCKVGGGGGHVKQPSFHKIHLRSMFINSGGGGGGNGIKVKGSTSHHK
jgi:hypothetical protein